PRVSFDYVVEEDRNVREQHGFPTRRSSYLSLFDRMVELRTTMARNAGFKDYRDYVFAAEYRFDYTPADTERLHAAIEATVVPAVDRKSTRLNSSHVKLSYAALCLQKNTETN